MGACSKVRIALNVIYQYIVQLLRVLLASHFFPSFLDILDSKYLLNEILTGQFSIINYKKTPLLLQ